MTRILFALILLAAACSCNSRPAYYDKVVDAAIRDVKAVSNSSPETMEREKAVLAIRVREQSLRANGLDNEADLYIETAHNLLVDSLDIIEPRQ